MRKSQSLIFKGAQLADSGAPREADVLIEDGVIKEVGSSVSKAGAKRLDASGLILMPALVDLHCHVRALESGHEEDVASLSHAAALGGYAWVLLMPNLSEAIDDPESFNALKHEIERSSVVPMEPAAALTKERAGERLSPMIDLAECGARFFTDDGSALTDPFLMREAMRLASLLQVTVMDHCEEKAIPYGPLSEGPLADAYGIEGMPDEAEALCLVRDLVLALVTGTRYHAHHLSRPVCIQLVRAFKELGARVSCEVCPHHLFFSQESVEGLNPLYKVNPPLVPEKKRQELLNLLLKGEIDAIATDHAPHPPERKELLFADAAYGISGITLALPLIYRLLIERGLTKAEVCRRVSLLMSKKPAEIAGIKDLIPEMIKAGEPASLIAFDPGMPALTGEAEFPSRGKNSPLVNKELSGRVLFSVIKGQMVVEEGELCK